MKIKLTFILVFAIATTSSSFCQNFKFGKVSKEELEEKVYALDSSASAAYLVKTRNTYTNVVGGDIELITEIHSRIKIYNKQGFDWATKEIELYKSSNSNRERVTALKAYTYNLENGQIVKTKLEKNEIFDENKSNYRSVKKFTMPNVKEGAVVEWSYKVYSPYFTNIDDVVVQYEIPVKHYDTKVKLLEWFNFNKRQKGYYPFRIMESSKRNANFDTNDKLITVSETNVPAIREEPYMNSIKNYTASLQLEVASLSAPKLQLFKNYSTTWEKIAENIYKNAAFGGELKKKSHLKDAITQLKSESPTLDEKISNAFSFVKSKIKWNGFYGIYTNKGLRKAYSENTGNVADINLTLVALLRELGLSANPVLISTRNNGIPLFPTSEGFNYVIACVEVQNNIVLLDATEPYSVPNILPLRDLNWQGRIVRENGSSTFINLFPSKHARETVFVKAELSEDGLISGAQRCAYSNLNALNYRNAKNKVAEDEIASSIEKKFSSIEIDNLKISNKENIEKPIVEMFEFESEDLTDVTSGKIFVSPLLFLAQEENPFKMNERKFPVDFGSPWEDRININLQLPQGYKVESMPEKMAIGLPDNLGYYKLMLVDLGTKVQVQSSIAINRPIIAIQHYKALQEFYKQIIDRHAEKIVLTKI